MVSEFIGKVQMQIQKSSSDFATWMLKFISGGFVSLTLSLVIMEMLGKSETENFLTFLFMMTVFTATFLRVAKDWTMTSVLIFDLICVLIGMVLRLYIMVAPGL